MWMSVVSFPRDLSFPFCFLCEHSWYSDKHIAGNGIGREVLIFLTHTNRTLRPQRVSVLGIAVFFPTLCWDSNAIKKRNEVKVQSWSFVHTHKKKSCVWFKVDTWLCQISPRTLHHLPSPRSYGAGSHCRRGLHCSWTLLFGHTWWFVADPRIPEEGEGIVFKQG